MATSSKTNMEDLRGKILSALEENLPKEIKDKFDDESKMRMEDEVTQTMNETLETISNIKDKNMMSLEALSHLSPSRIDMFLSCFSVKVYETIINSDKSVVEYVSDGKPFFKSIHLSSSGEVETAMITQVADIILEAVIMILQIAGISVSLSESTKREGLRITQRVAEGYNAIVNIIHECVRYYRENNRGEMFGAIFRIVYRLYDFRCFIDILGVIFASFGWLDWALLVARFIAYLLTAYASGGLATLAEFISAAVNATEFLRKMSNMVTFTSLASEGEKMD